MRSNRDEHVERLSDDMREFMARIQEILKLAHRLGLHVGIKITEAPK